MYGNILNILDRSLFINEVLWFLEIVINEIKFFISINVVFKFYYFICIVLGMVLLVENKSVY